MTIRFRPGALCCIAFAWIGSACAQTSTPMQPSTPPALSTPAATAKRIMLADRFPDDVKSRNLYVDGDDAVKAVDAALMEAKAANKRVLIIVGTDICHDTRGLLGWMKQPDAAALLDANYVRVLVDSGSRKERNLPLLARFGVKEIKYTPTVVIIDPATSNLINADAISTLGSADSQDPAFITEYFLRYRTAR